MVLSNKKLKEKLRAAKVELLAAQLKVSGGDPNPKTEESLQTILKSVAQKPKLSKREKRREKAQSLPEISDTIAQVGGEIGSGDVKEEEKNKRKRKRGDKDGLESGQEVKTAEKKTKKKKKKKKKKKQKKSKGKKEGANEEVKEVVKSGEEEGGVQPIQAIECKENADVSTKVYVGGIPYYSNEDDIRSYFEGCGTITEVDCMTFPDTGKFRGIAIINFKTEAAAKRALALDGSDMGGLFLRIQPYNSSRVKSVNKVSNFTPAVVEGYNKIYIGNLSWEITEDDLRKLFSDCTITSIRFGEDKETGEFKGYAHIDFADSVSLNNALKLDQKIVCGRPVRITRAVPPKKGVVTKSRSTQSDTQVENVDDSKGVIESDRIEKPKNSIVDTPKSIWVDDAPQSNQADPTAAVVSSALSVKIRRRTCYECGERGHLSSSCPKKLAEEQGNQADTPKTIRVDDAPQSNQLDPTAAAVSSALSAKNSIVDTPKTIRVDDAPQSNRVDPTAAAVSSALSAKIRRRTCYECGERGHLSSSCPKKLAEEQGNQAAAS